LRSLSQHLGEVFWREKNRVVIGRHGVTQFQGVLQLYGELSGYMAPHKRTKK